MKHISSNLESVLFVFDEPTVGLHEVEKTAMLKNLRGLCHGKNGLIIVEHDRNTIELGPGGGNEGGEVISSRQSYGRS